MEREQSGLKLLAERFGRDSLIALATVHEKGPSVRTVNSYYEDGSFYVITHAGSHKMREIEAHSTVALCGEWMTAHGIGISMGHICDETNRALSAKLRDVFSAWYSNGHVDEGDPQTIILRVQLTDAVLFCNGTRYELHFH